MNSFGITVSRATVGQDLKNWKRTNDLKKKRKIKIKNTKALRKESKVPLTLNPPEASIKLIF